MIERGLRGRNKKSARRTGSAKQSATATAVSGAQPEQTAVSESRKKGRRWQVPSASLASGVAVKSVGQDRWIAEIFQSISP